ncbi:MAG: hypothetical protein HQL69_02200 [Magnetococcales bacterium]|nr:hypothetical protein [Magnetococcales bacterium]
MIKIYKIHGIFLSFLLSFLLLSTAGAGDGSKWSYDDNGQDGYVGEKRNRNPWTGERSGPLATNKAEQFNYGDERRVEPPPSLEDLYPKQGGANSGKRPWGDVPKEFQDSQSNTYYDEPASERKYGSGGYSQDGYQWPERETSRGGYDSLRGEALERPNMGYLYPEYGRPRARPYLDPSPGYGDYYRRPHYRPLYNDSDIGYGSWQGSDYLGRGRGLYRNYNLIPRY